MKKIILKEYELVKLIETAMDLDIYVQPVDYDTNNGNIDFKDSTESVIDRLKELIYMSNSGKKINTETKQKLFRIQDLINSIYDEIKYNK